jgi:hypothetical protein
MRDRHRIVVTLDRRMLSARRYGIYHHPRRLSMSRQPPTILLASTSTYNVSASLL